MKCNNCKCEIPDDSIFCPNCGSDTKMERERTKSKPAFKISLKGILIVIALGIWMLVLQGLGIIPTTQDVKVTKTVKISGDVGINNPIDVNLQYINGRSDVFFNNPRRGDKDKYYLIPVTVE